MTILSAGTIVQSWCSACNQSTPHLYQPRPTKAQPAILQCQRCAQIEREQKEAQGDTAIKP